MTALTPLGTARERFLRELGLPPEHGDEAALHVAEVESEPDALEPAYLGWEIARCARGLDAEGRRVLAVLAAACVASMRAGSTRLPLDHRLEGALEVVGGRAALGAVQALLARARAGVPSDPVVAVVGLAGDRAPLVIDGEWLYAERMRRSEERFCARVRERLATPRAQDARALGRVLKAISEGPPPLTDEQKRAVRESLSAPFALVTGGPGTGKTSIVVAVLRALAWTGLPMESVAIAAPTGKAAQRLQEAIATGLAAAPRDIAEAGLRAIAPAPQTLHRLLGWSPSSGRFARHENDPLPQRVVIVDEASMIDLAMMDRLLRALREDARLVLLGDADQLPSVDAGAVFRDLCAGLGAVRLTENLRVARDASARRIVAAARAVNAGSLDAGFAEAVATRSSVAELALDGVEHLDAPWAEVGEALLDRWWAARVGALEDFARRASRTFHVRPEGFEEEERLELRALLDHHARARILCATRLRGFSAGADAINDRLLARLRGAVTRSRRRPAEELAAGAPVMVQRNDYERRLFNGDQGLVVRVEAGSGSRLAAVFPRGDAFEVFPLDALPDLAPAFAMTVHKAQGSEFDHVALVLPESDMPLLTRELLYTAMTRARRSVLVAGQHDLLARAVSRGIDRHSGVAERLAGTRK